MSDLYIIQRDKTQYHVTLVESETMLCCNYWDCIHSKTHNCNFTLSKA